MEDLCNYLPNWQREASSMEIGLCITWQRWCAGSLAELFEVNFHDISYPLQETKI